MNNGGDYDDAISVIDIWLHDHPETSPWEHDEFSPPLSEDPGGYSWDRPRRDGYGVYAKSAN